MVPNKQSEEQLAYNKILDGLYRWKRNSNGNFEDSPLSDAALDAANQLIAIQPSAPLHAVLKQKVDPLTFQAAKESVPSILEIAKFIERLFAQVDNNQVLASSFHKILLSLKASFFKLSLIDHRFLKDKDHIARIYLSELTRVGITLSEESLLSTEINKIAHAFVTNSATQNTSKDFQSLLENAHQQLTNFVHSVEKRAFIFEKRSREIAEGKARAESAKQWASYKVNHYLHLVEWPEFIYNMLKDAWQHVVFLERLKTPESEELTPLSSIKKLAVTLQSVESFDDFEKFLDLQPIVVSEISDGLEKSSYSMKETTDFLEQLDALHDEIIVNARESIEKGPKEEIIRLKPKNILEFEDTTKKEEKNEKPIIEDDEADISAMSLDEWTNHIFNKLSELNPVEQLDSLELDLIQTENQIPTQNQVLNWQAGQWFDLVTTEGTTRCKLASIIKSTSVFIFVDNEGTKILESELEEVTLKFEAGELQPLKDTASFEAAYKSSLSDALNDHLAKVELKRKKAEEARIAEEKRKAEEKAKRLAEEQARREREEQIDSAKAKIKAITTGSWLGINKDGKTKKCRIAARLAKSNKYILTDRSGVKILEPTLEEMAELLVDGELNLTLENDLFNQAIASVITEGRRAEKK